jgi:putative DNA methylase
MSEPQKKKLIEVALPLDAINKASAREKSIRHGHPSTLHLWWARRPLAAARAVIFAQMVDDPSAHPELFPTEEAQEHERQRLFRLIEELVLWENTTNEAVLSSAREEIWKSWRATCAENREHPRAAELFNADKLPAFHDPFAGGGSLPLEAQRLGLEAYASDLNPVAVLICKAMIEIPPKFAGKPPVNPDARKEKTLLARECRGAQGLAEDVRYYGQWMRDEAERRIGHLYPKVKITAEMAKDRPDLTPLVGRKLTVIAWLWARTVKSPNPAFAQVDVPLASTFMLSTKAGKEAYVEPVLEAGGYRFSVKVGKPQDTEAAKNGTKLARGANFRCLMSSTPISGEYIKAEGKAGRMGARMMAIVAEAERGRVYLAPTLEHETIAHSAEPEWKPEGSMVEDARAFTPFLYGLAKWRDLFAPRQIMALTTFSDLVQEARERIYRDAVDAGLPDNQEPLRNGGTGVTAYAEAASIYWSFALSKVADRGSTLTRWMPARDSMYNTFSRQALPMSWDFVEVNPIGQQTGGYAESLRWTLEALEGTPASSPATAYQLNVGHLPTERVSVFSTDPPYYDNVPYADLSDFFYVWLRRLLRPVFPDLFATLAVPKAEELVATPYRHGNKESAEKFFLDGMTLAMHRLAEQAHPAFPVTIYYAFKQAEADGVEGTASTGWETFLDAVIRAGLSISGTWPVRTELGNRMRGMDSNALASSIVLVCRPHAVDASTATRREFVTALKAALPVALAHLQRGNIAPVDLAQAAIGPGMAVYTHYVTVLDAEGKPLSVRDALALINQTLDEALAEQEGDFDADSRWALAWFEQQGFAEGEFGSADVLARAKNTSVDGMNRAGIVISGRGKVRLLKPAELPADWDPATDPRLTAWEVVHHLTRALDAGEETAAALLSRLRGVNPAKADAARELAYRLYTLCERKKRAPEALAYNSLVVTWPELMRLAREGGEAATQTELKV